jgi:hypothetical protein
MGFDLSAFFAFGVEKCHIAQETPPENASLGKIFTKTD